MSNRRGFTLVELIVLIGIFALVVAMGVPAVSKYVRSNRLATTTERMAADMNMFRSMSIANGRIYQMAAHANGYKVTDAVTGQTVSDRNYERGVTLVAPATVNFFPWGLADAATFDLSGCTGTRRINLLPTGAVEVQ